MARILIMGAGGHGKVVADLVRAAGHELVGFADANADRHDTVAEPGGARVLLVQESLLALIATDGVFPFGVDQVALAVGDNESRLRLLDALVHWNAGALVHPRATVSASATLGRGTVVFPNAVINAAAVLGDGVIVNTAAVIEHDCTVADGVHLSPGSTLCGNVRVGRCSWIGAGAVVIPGISIGAGARIGAGAVVIRDVAPHVTVAGVPARALSSQ
ncbi:MAG: putative acetyltransferase [Gemmatimonadetes bacterium]|nr:putative acetyltransferase [Gemmatimonadota bacterium]